jgi:hypothetical protein
MPTLEDIDLEQLNERVEQKVEHDIQMAQGVFLAVSFMMVALFTLMGVVIEDSLSLFLFFAALSAFGFHFGSFMMNTEGAKKQMRAKLLSQELGANIQELLRDSQELLRDSQGKRKRSTTRLEDVLQDDGEIIMLEEHESDTHTNKS